MEPDALSTIEAAASAQPWPESPHAALACGADPCEPALAGPPIDECKRELDAVLASLGDA